MKIASAARDGERAEEVVSRSDDRGDIDFDDESEEFDRQLVREVAEKLHDRPASFEHRQRDRSEKERDCEERCRGNQRARHSSREAAVDESLPQRVEYVGHGDREKDDFDDFPEDGRRQQPGNCQQSAEDVSAASKRVHTPDSNPDGKTVSATAADRDAYVSPSVTTT